MSPEEARNLPDNTSNAQLVESSTEDSFISLLAGSKHKKYARMVMAALGCLPWVGSVISAAADVKAGNDQDKQNELQRLWLQEHKDKIYELGKTFQDIVMRLDSFGDEIQNRIESEEYLALVRRTFSSWDKADTLEKRQMLKRLITNAGAIKLCQDDLIRLFANWVDQYHEAHFLVIKQIYNNPNTSRGQIWDAMHPSRPREDSAEADLFRYLIRDLSTGGVIRQTREKNEYGEFIKKSAGKTHGSRPSGVMESAFEDEKTYELTELGSWFVHYVMDDVAVQIGVGTGEGT